MTLGIFPNCPTSSAVIAPDDVRHFSKLPNVSLCKVIVKGVDRARVPPWELRTSVEETGSQPGAGISFNVGHFSKLPNVIRGKCAGRRAAFFQTARRLLVKNAMRDVRHFLKLPNVSLWKVACETCGIIPNCLTSPGPKRGARR